MFKMYRNGQECMAEYDQREAMENAGWSLNPQVVKEKSGNANAPAAPVAASGSVISQKPKPVQQK